MVDFGSLAQARGPMGLSKQDPIRTLLSEPDISAQWTERFGALPGSDDIATASPSCREPSTRLPSVPAPAGNLRLDEPL